MYYMYSLKCRNFYDHHTTESYGSDLIGYKVEKPLNNGHLKITNSMSSNRCRPNQTKPDLRFLGDLALPVLQNGINFLSQVVCVMVVSHVNPNFIIMSSDFMPCNTRNPVLFPDVIVRSRCDSTIVGAFITFSLALII